MKLLFSSMMALVVALTQVVTYAAVTLTSDQDKLSYAIGHNVGVGLRAQHIKVRQDPFMQGVEDGLTGQSPLLTAGEESAVFKKITASVIEKTAAMGRQFLAVNAKKPGVKTTASGLQYKVLKMGVGPKPLNTDRVTVDYEGRFIDGKLFDSSYERGKPVTFPVDEVILGWTEALQMMPVGSIWILYIPAKLAYGEQGFASIGPEQTLQFKLHLIAIEKVPTDRKSASIAQN